MDLGSNFFGAGSLFYNEYEGLASAKYMRESGLYGARTLGLYDFMVDEEVLVRQLNESGVPVVASNLDVAGSPLEDVVTQFAVVENNMTGVTTAVMSLIDTRIMGPYFAPRAQSYEFALSSVVVQLFQRPTPVDYVVILVVGGVPEDDVTELLSTIQVDAGETAESDAIIAIARRFVGINLIVVDGTSSLGHMDFAAIDNIGGYKTFVMATTNATHGSQISEYQGSFFVGAKTVLDLNCSAPEHNTTRFDLNEDKERVEANIEVAPAGFISKTVLASDCRDEKECFLGNLVADATRWYANVDIALIDDESLTGDLVQFSLTREQVRNAVSHLADEIVVVREVLGARLRFVLQDAVTRNDMMQISKSLNISWSMVGGNPVLADAVHVNGFLLDDTAYYSVAASESLWNSRFPPVPWTERWHLGVSHYDCVGEYMDLFHSAEASGLDPAEEYKNLRTKQTDPISLLHVAFFCGDNRDSVARLEDCDHAMHALRLLNGHTDGYHDELIPFVRFIPHIVYVDCASGGAYDALVQLVEALQQDIFAVFTWCSTEAAELASLNARAQYRFLGWNPYIVFAPASTATELEDELVYPFVVRLSTSDRGVSRATTDVFDEYKWKRAILVHDDTVWGRSSAQAFADAFAPNYILGDGSCVADVDCGQSTFVDDRSVGVPFSLAGLDAGDFTAYDIVNDIDGAGNGNIVVVAAQPRAQRALYAAAFREDVKIGVPFGWVTMWPTEDSFVSYDGAVDFDALDGHEGVLGFIEHRPTYGLAGNNDDTDSLFRLWQAVANKEACTNRELLPLMGTFRLDVSDSYCDADGDPTTMSPHGLIFADAALILAIGVHRSTHVTAEFVYDTIVGGEDVDPERAINYPVPGASGSITITESGDRIGLLDLDNLQVFDTPIPARRLEHSVQLGRRHSRDVVISGASADFRVVGSYAVEANELVIEERAVIFPGGSTDPPRDHDPSLEGGSKKKNNNDVDTTIWLTIVAVLVVVVVAVCLFARRYQQRTRRLNEQLNEASNVYFVEKPFKEQNVDDDGKNAKNNLADGEEIKEDVLTVELAERSFERELWCWELDSGEAPPSGTRVVDERWVAYDDDVQDSLSELLHRYKQLTPEVRELYALGGDAANDYLETADADEEGTFIHYHDTNKRPTVPTPIDRNEPVSYRYTFTTKGSDGDRTFQIDIATMVQLSTQTNKMRNIRVVPGGREVTCDWYWKEDFRRLGAWDAAMQRPGGWIKFKAKAQPPLSEAYRLYLEDPERNDSIVYFTADHEATDADDEYAHWQVDLSTMIQTNLRDRHKGRGCERRVWPFLTTLGARPTSGSLDGHTRYKIPERLKEQPLLWLEANTRVLLLQQDDDWGYGTTLDTHQPGPGWFPMDCVKRADIPDAEAKLLARPHHWTKDQTALFVPLTNADVTTTREARLVPQNAEKERYTIVKLFDPAEYDVVSVKRIQNINLWRAYVIQVINAQKAANHPVVLNGPLEHRPVFHGTDEKSVDSIAKRGFNRDYCSPHVMHGRGSYFATSASYSCRPQYAKPNGRQEQFVVVGRALESTPSADKDEESDIGDDDSSISDTGTANRGILVVAEDHHAYPEYIVKFQMRHMSTYFSDPGLPSP